MNQQVKDHIELHFLVLLWGIPAALGLLITIPAVEIVFFRTLISFVFLGIGLSFTGQGLTLPIIDLARMFFVGFLFAINWILFFLAAKVSNASLCLAGMATTAIWSSLLEPLFQKNKINRLQVLFAFIALLGISIVLNIEFDRALGLFLSIGAALFAAIFTIANKHIVKRHEPIKIMFYEMLGAFIATTLFLPFYIINFSRGKLVLNPTRDDWFYLTIIGLICTVYAHTMSVKLLKRISAFTMSFTTNLEPVYGIILAFLILGESERMSAGFYLGTGLVLVSVIVYSYIEKDVR